MSVVPSTPPHVFILFLIGTGLPETLITFLATTQRKNIKLEKLRVIEWDVFSVPHGFNFLSFYFPIPREHYADWITARLMCLARACLCVHDLKCVLLSKNRSNKHVHGNMNITHEYLCRLTHTHAGTHTYTHTHIHTHTRLNTHTRALTHTCPRPYTNGHTHT